MEEDAAMEDDAAMEEEMRAKEMAQPSKPINDSFNGWDKRKIFSSPTAANFGSIIELKEIEHLNSLFSNRNDNPNVPQQPIDSQMPSLSDGLTVPNMIKGGQAPPKGEAGGQAVELHMVYADWCGHSQTALKKFEGLVDKQDVKTSSGKKVNFVLTEESSEGMKEFKGKVKGFPTYMLKDNGNLSEIDVGDRSEGAIINAAKEL
jgi:thiol-disulfide isomerase/thioredoxin